MAGRLLEMAGRSPFSQANRLAPPRGSSA